MRPNVFHGVVLALAGFSCVSSCRRGGPVSDWDVRPDRPWDTGLPEAQVLPDTLPDTRPDRPQATGDILSHAPRPEGTHYDFCGEPIIELPRHEPYAEYRDARPGGLDEHGVAYYYFHDAPSAFYFDFSTCTEYELNSLFTPDWADPFIAGLDRGQLLIKVHNKVHDGTNALVVLDIATWTAKVVHRDSEGDSNFNATISGGYVASFNAPYRFTQDAFYSSLKTLYLIDVQTGRRSVLWTGTWVDGGPMDMTDDLFVFRDTGTYCHGPSSGWYVDLHTSQADPLLGLCDGEHPTWFFASGYRVGYMREYNVYDNETTCGVKDVTEGWNILLTEDDHTVCFGALEGDLVLWNTDAYGTYPDADYLVGDIVAMDLATGLTRRLTTEARHVGVAPFTALPRIMVAAWRHDVPVVLAYIVDLQALGVVDDTGKLLAGPPLEEITLLGDR